MQEVWGESGVLPKTLKAVRHEDVFMGLLKELVENMWRQGDVPADVRETGLPIVDNHTIIKCPKENSGEKILRFSSVIRAPTPSPWQLEGVWLRRIGNQW